MGRKKYKRTPRNYDGIERPHKEISALLPGFLDKVLFQSEGESELVFAKWRELVGSRISNLAEPKSFEAGVLRIIVKTSTLYSLLVQQERPRLLKEIQKAFPNLMIKNILFSIG